MTGYDQEGKRQAQGGVQSIFTTHQRRHGNAIPATGLLAVAGGVSIWAWTLMNLNNSNGSNISQSVASSALTFASLGMFIVLAGMGLSVYSLAVRGTRRWRNERGSSLYSDTLDPARTNELSDVDMLTRQSWDPTRLKSTHRLSKTFVAALIQNLVYVAAYWGLVAEYNSNARMQAWVQTNLPIVGDLLTYYGVVLLFGLMAVLLVRFLPREHSTV